MPGKAVTSVDGHIHATGSMGAGTFRPKLTESFGPEATECPTEGTIVSLDGSEGKAAVLADFEVRRTIVAARGAALGVLVAINSAGMCRPGIGNFDAFKVFDLTTKNARSINPTAAIPATQLAVPELSPNVACGVATAALLVDPGTQSFQPLR